VCPKKKVPCLKIKDSLPFGGIPKIERKIERIFSLKNKEFFFI